MVPVIRRALFPVILLFFFIGGCLPINQQKDATSTDLIVPQYSFISSSGLTSGPLQITTIELKFQNGLGDITLTSKTPPQPEAIIKFNGNGLFQAYWQVDNRDIEPVSINVTFGKTLKLRVMNTTQIPTYQPGQHHVNLRIISPKTKIKSPAITYFVQLQ